MTARSCETRYKLIGKLLIWNEKKNKFFCEYCEYNKTSFLFNLFLKKNHYRCLMFVSFNKSRFNKV